MKISLNWIRQFVDIPTSLSAHQLAELLTLRTCEVEGFEDQRLKFANMVVGVVKAVRPHPNAYKLCLIDTDIGGQVGQIVCAGQNVKPEMYVAVALPGAVVHWHGEAEAVELKETKIRGEKSVGMICAEEEIGLTVFTPQEGIAIADLAYAWRAMGTKPAAAGTPLSDALLLNDVIFEIDNKSLTNRPDLWGHYGMAREFAAFLGKKLKSLEDRLKIPRAGERVTIEITSKELCSRFQSVIISDVKVERSPAWLAQKLEAVGMRPINNIVDITNYVMLELGHPLHAFDRNVVGNDHFVIRAARQGERMKTLDGKDRVLLPEDTLVTNGDTPLALAGVMGGEHSGISLNTTEIILEVATWNPILVRKTAQRHVLRTDAAQRFEKSLDPETAIYTFMRACQLITEICPGAKLAGPTTDVFPSPPKPMQVVLNVENTQKKIGAPIPAKEMAMHLTSLGFGVKAAGKDSLKVTVPSFRATKDINIEEDLVEEVARMHGYEKIALLLPELPISLPHENHERELEHRIRKILSLGLGMSETLHYSFYGTPEISKCMLLEAAHVKIKNPLTADQTHMRVSLIPTMLKSVAHNLTTCSAFTLYEIGRSYIKTNDFMPREEKFIAAVTVHPMNKKEIFYDALGQLETCLRNLGIHTFTRAATATTEPRLGVAPYAHPSKCVAIMVKGQEIAIAYELHPEVLKKNDIASVCAAFEVNFTKLAALPREEFAYQPLPRFPGISFDISVLVARHTAVREVSELAKKSAGELAQSVTLIDTFEGPSLGENKKSLTLRIALQSGERTLTDAEMKDSHSRVCTVLTGAGFAIRG